MLSGRSRLLGWSCGVRCWGCELLWRSCEVLCWKFELLCVYASASLGHASPHYVFGLVEGWLMAPRSYLGFSGLLWGGVRVPTLCFRRG